jgi:hypothetical protein
VSFYDCWERRLANVALTFHKSHRFASYHTGTIDFDLDVKIMVAQPGGKITPFDKSDAIANRPQPLRWR